MTAEHAAGVGGEVALTSVERACFHAVDCLTPGSDLLGIAERALVRTHAATRQAAADTVLAEARRLCCGDNPAPEHNARADHSQRMAFAEELARAVRHA